MGNQDHITVCICTYKRPKLLQNLLIKLENQKTEGLFSYSIVVVDNDSAASAKSTVESVRRNSRIAIEFHVEPEQNIALARNKAVQNARGEFVAFIDDDEFPATNWLLILYQMIKKNRVDGVLGPVFPHFECKPPRWVTRGRLFERPTHATGTILNWTNTRTGNVLLRTNLFEGRGNLFDPRFGSGGEDRDFFRRMDEKGHVFLWCNEAPVYEIIPPDRWKRLVLLKRALLRGKISLNHSSFGPNEILKSFVAIPAYSLALPVLFFLDHQIFMKYLIKDCDHIGRLLALCGVEVVKERYVTK
jgi:succinoglycan biosynthesis protein ExoM